MDGATLNLIIFLGATFVAALVAGLAGFAFGLIAAAAWLYVLPPLQVAMLIVAYGLIVQGIAVWKLRSALDWSRLWPFLAGAALGVPAGIAVLHFAEPDYLRAGIGVILVLYSLYALLRPPLSPVRDCAPADLAAGLLNGVVGGMSGLAGIVVTIWSGVRGWPKDIQRAVFQPVAVATFAMSASWFAAFGDVSRDIIFLFVIGLPALLAGTWLGLKLYGRLDEAGFRRAVLGLLLVSGLFLIAAFR